MSERTVDELCAELTPLIVQEKFESASALLLKQHDLLACAVLTRLSDRLLGDYYRDNTRAYSYFFGSISQLSCKSKADSRVAIYLCATQTFIDKFSNENNPLFWTIKSITSVNPNIAVELLKSIQNGPRLARLIAELAGARQSTDILQYLQDMIHDSRAEVRLAVVLAMGGIADPGCFPMLLHLINDANADVRLKAIEALFSIDRNRAASEISRLGVDNCSRVRIRTLQLFGTSGNLVCLGQLRAAATCVDDPLTRVHAIRSIGMLRPNVPPPEVIASVKDIAADVRGMAAWALGQIRDPIALKHLKEMEAEPDEYAAWSASKAVRAIEELDLGDRNGRT